MDSGDSSQPRLRTETKKKRNNAGFADFMAKLFIKNYKDVENPTIRKRYGYLGSLYGFITNIMLFCAKIICSFIFDLDTLRADAINNASDIGMCLIALVSVYFASKPASKEHPYGSSRFEYVASLVIALLIIVISGSQIVSTVQEVIEAGGLVEATVVYSSAEFYVPFAVMCCSVIIKLSQFFLLTGLAKRTTSMTLMATGQDARNDSMVSAVIAISLLLSFPIGWDIDPITAIAVSVLVCFSGIGIIKEAASAILGVTPPKEIIRNFALEIQKYPLVLGIHDLEMHSYGNNVIHAYVHVEVNSSISIMTIRDEVDHIEKQLEKDTGIRTVIHIDPIQVDDEDTSRYRDYVIEAAREVDPDIAVNDFRLLKNDEHPHQKILSFDLVLPYDLLPQDHRVVRKIKEIVRSFTNESLSFSIDVDDRTSDLLLILQDDDKFQQ